MSEKLKLDRLIQVSVAPAFHFTWSLPLLLIELHVLTFHLANVFPLTYFYLCWNVPSVAGYLFTSTVNKYNKLIAVEREHGLYLMAIVWVKLHVVFVL